MVVYPHGWAIIERWCGVTNNEQLLVDVQAVHTWMADPTHWIKKISLVFGDRGGELVPTSACLMGAIALAVARLEIREQVPVLVRETMRGARLLALMAEVIQGHPVYVDVQGEVVVGWNDDPHRTHEEVMAMLDRAVAHARAMVEVERTVAAIPEWGKTLMVPEPNTVRVNPKNNRFMTTKIVPTMPALRQLIEV